MATSKRLPILTEVLWFCAVLAVAQPAPAAVVINELHADPDVKTELVEFVELYNDGAEAVALSGWSLAGGVFYTFPAGTSLPAAGYLVVVQSPDHFQAGRTATGFNVPESLLYGPFGGKLGNDGDRVVLADAAGEVVDEVTYQLGFPWPTVGEPITNGQPGTGGSLQLVNPRFDNDLGGSWRSARATPAVRNRVYSETLPPQIRQVKHAPNQPRSGQAVTITAKITDPDGVQTSVLTYQVVTPGNYVSLQDATYESNWVMVDMHDDGLAGDTTAHDSVYTAQIPDDAQVHRNLIRYRIFALDSLGANVTVPYDDDPQPNFAYFVYDGVPAWSGAIQPGAAGERGEVVEYSSAVLQSLPVYHFIAKNQDVLDALHMPGAHGGEYWGSGYPWYGTMVYDGKVYDHITFRARGGVWRYSMGKNMWKFDFKRGHSFQARDDYGRPYDTTWDKMNFSACIQQGDYQHRGEQGMFEAAAFKLFNMMGVEAPKTNWLHLRVVDEADEQGPTQYDGDFWGLYMTIEQMDGRFLNEHDLLDGNLYKIEGGMGDLNNQGPTAVTDGSDLRTFMSGYRGRPESGWWYDNVNLAGYYGYRCVVEGVHHGDIAYGKNWFFYLNPETNRWSMLPWDVDLTWANNMYGNGRDDFLNAGQIFRNDDLEIAYQNRLREFLDLLYNADQAYQLLDEMANIIDPPTGGPTFVGADRAMWDYSPIMTSNVVNYSKAGQGRFYQQAATRDFRGMVQIMKDYIVSGNRSFDSYFEDPDIPGTPVVAATGPAGFPLNALTFRVTPFVDPQGPGTFNAMKWRLGEVAAGSQIIRTSDASGFTFVPDGAQWRYFKGVEEPSEEVGAWRQVDFDDSDWLTGQTAIGFGEGFIATNLSDMRGSYSTVYLRKTFEVTAVDALGQLILELKYDDGINVWINGHLAFQDNVASEDMSYDATAISAIEITDFTAYGLGVPADLLVEGTNVIAIQVLNASLAGSSDCFIDARLTGEPLEEPDEGDDETPAMPQIYRGEPGKYEIDPVWQSGLLAAFNADVTIPASVVRTGRTYRLRCAVQDNSGRWSHWSAPIQFVTGEAVAAGILADLRLTELMYNPADAPVGDATANDEFEFIELMNVGDETLDLSTVSLTDGVDFAFADSDVTTLEPGQFVLVVRNRAAFLSRYGTALEDLIAGEYQGQLSNGGENVKLEDFWNGTIVEFEYSDGRGWPLAADGAGHSLVPLDSAILGEPTGSLNYGGNWRASATMGGSPGTDDPQPQASMVINEFYAGSSADDWVELYNPTGADIDLADFYLSDDVEDLAKWAVAAPVLEAGAFRTFEESGDDLGFGLSRSGEQLILTYLPGDRTDRIVDSIRFKGQENVFSLGRYPDGGSWWFRLEPSRNAANLTPVADVVIDEVMYHPVDPNDEYIEVLNPTDVAIELSNPTGSWRLSGAIEYAFAVGASLEPGARLVVVGFDPLVETARFESFVAAYGAETLVPGVDVVGPWQGSLANAGERLALEKPQPTGNVDDPVAWVIVDEVIYSDVAPWPTAADGTGAALQRASTDPTLSGSDPANWQAAPPTPGTGI